jgi:hypothetical protein
MNKLIDHRDEFPRLMEELGCETAVEVGVAEGWFARKLLQCSTLKRLVLVDPWLNRDHRRACKKLAKEDKRVELRQATSLEAARDLTQRFDFAYVDAMHDYAAVRDDLQAWWPLTTKLMAGHDYTLNPLPVGYHNGVILAVEEFFRDEDVYVIGADETTYLDRLRAATNAALLEDLGPWNSHNPSWYVFKEPNA